MDKCCEAMAEIMRMYNGPFYYPIRIDTQTNDIKADKLGVKLYNLTPSKKAIARGSATAYLNFCPFCGKDL